MAPPTLLVLGYSEAAMLLGQSNTPEVTAIISIHGRNEYPLDVSGIRHRLVLHFDDADVIDMSDPQRALGPWARQRWSAQQGRPLTPPQIEDARAIIEFARVVAGLDGVVLCQCQGGVSRSSAAALLCLATWSEEGQEQACLEQVLRIRPCAAPHPDLIRFGDQLLNRSGKLIGALNKRFEK